MIKLKGGNMSEVYYKEGKVYRLRNKYSSAVHDFLNHLAQKKIPFVPQYCGDEGDYECLTFVSGKTLSSYPPTEGREVIVEGVAKMMRTFHDATVDYVPTSSYYLSYPGTLPTEVMCHNDIAPYNVTFEDNNPVGMIDFDTICPGPRIWDLVYAAYRFIPLTATNSIQEIEHRKSLLSLFMTTYGMVIPNDFDEILVMRLRTLIDLIEAECRVGNTSFIKMKEDGHIDEYEGDIAYIKRQFNAWNV